MPEWAPIVHGRTLYADYRPNLIAVPEGFTAREIGWAQEHILATTRSLSASSGNPIWSAFTGERCGVVGVTCWARDVSEEMTRDEKSREVYAFLGYACPLPFPGLPPRDLSLFAPLYDLVKKRWLEREYDSREAHPHPFSFDLPLIEHAVGLNLDVQKAAVWPVDEDERLWRAASLGRTVSLCLGLPRSQEAVKGPFLNATAGDVEQPRILLRPGEEPAETRAEEQRLPNPEMNPERMETKTGPYADRAPEEPDTGLLGFFPRLLRSALRSILGSPEEPPPHRTGPAGALPDWEPEEPDSRPAPPRREGPPPGFRRLTAPERKRNQKPWDGWE